MIIVDVNLLVYAVNEEAPFHQKAKSWLESAVSGTETVGLPWIVLLAFLRLTTRAGVFKKPLPLETAFDLVDAWLEQPSVTVPEPTARHPAHHARFSFAPWDRRKSYIRCSSCGLSH
jgi:uncharacterized protein